MQIIGSKGLFAILLGVAGFISLEVIYVTSKEVPSRLPETPRTPLKKTTPRPSKLANLQNGPVHGDTLIVHQLPSGAYVQYYCT